MSDVSESLISLTRNQMSEFPALQATILSKWMTSQKVLNLLSFKYVPQTSSDDLCLSFCELFIPWS